MSFNPVLYPGLISVLPVSIQGGCLLIRCLVGHEGVYCLRYPVPTCFTIFQSSLLTLILPDWSTISGSFLILAPGKCVTRSIPKASSNVLDRSSVESLNGSFTAPLSFARIFLSLENSGVLSIDSQNLLQLSTLARLIAFLYWH